MICMKNLLPENLTLGRKLDNGGIKSSVTLVSMRSNWQQVLTVDCSTLGELPCDIKVAMGVGHRTDDVVKCIP